MYDFPPDGPRVEAGRLDRYEGLSISGSKDLVRYWEMWYVVSFLVVMIERGRGVGGYGSSSCCLHACFVMWRV